jgi:hypothetical protein
VEILALDAPDACDIEQMRPPPLANFSPSFGAASSVIAIIASGTALIQSSRTGLSSSALTA